MEDSDCYICVMKYVFLYLKIFGLSGIIPDKVCKHESGRHSNKRQIIEFLTTLLSWGQFSFWFTLLVIEIKYGLGNTFHLNFLKKYTNGIRFFLSFQTNLIFFYSCIQVIFNFFRNKDIALQIVELWHKQSQNKPYFSSKSGIPKIVRASKIAGLCLPFIMIIVVIGITSLFKQIYRDAIREIGYLTSLCYLILYVISFCYGFGIFMTAYIYVVFICFISRNKFIEIANELKTFMKNPERVKYFKTIQSRHNSVCKLVELFDNVFQYYVFLVYFHMLPLTCFMSYQALFEGRPTIITIAIINVVLSMVLTFTSLTIICGSVTSAADYPRKVIHEIFNLEIPSEIRLQATIFLRRLNGPTIGYTCLNLFVITKNTLSSMLSIFITYFLLYIQFMKE
ncbi:uncharacterized protein [Centruroides vittatus]|uniref:uncharacterized protein n=1 Tax=Centruroides vittatus TaxID=120091 RepID=UPI00350ECED2